jgi:DNA-binding MarR family transcriptional regulator
MPTSATRKTQLLHALGSEIRRMGAQNVLISAAVAERVGLASSDLECLDMVVMGNGSMTPGGLAAATGLTSGAITGLIDRLERAGCVKRKADRHDRRKLFVVANPERVREIGLYYEPLQASTTALWARYTAEQLHTILEFVRRSSDLAALELESLQRAPVRHDDAKRQRSSRRREARAST